MPATDHHDGGRVFRIFNKIVLAAIIANTGVLVWGLLDHTHEELIETLDYSLLWFFVFEIAVRLKMAGRSWRNWAWVTFDAIIIFLAMLPLGANVSALRVMRACRMVHFSRHMPHLRHMVGARWIAWAVRNGQGAAQKP